MGTGEDAESGADEVSDVDGAGDAEGDADEEAEGGKEEGSAGGATSAKRDPPADAPRPAADLSPLRMLRTIAPPMVRASPASVKAVSGSWSTTMPSTMVTTR